MMQKMINGVLMGTSVLCLTGAILSLTRLSYAATDPGCPNVGSESYPNVHCNFPPNWSIVNSNQCRNSTTLNVCCSYTKRKWFCQTANGPMLKQITYSLTSSGLGQCTQHPTDGTGTCVTETGGGGHGDPN
jgi:hypothetical protein